MFLSIVRQTYILDYVYFFMKKGQSGVIALVIIGLVLVGLLAFIAFKLTTPKITGNVVNPSATNNAVLELSATGFLRSSSCMINPPFYCNAWNIKENQVALEIMNNGGETYNIKSLTLSSCGSVGSALSLGAGTKGTITLNCAITDKDNFDTELIIRYSK